MIKTKLPDLTPASERLKKTIDLISGGYSLKPEVTGGKVTVYPWDSEVSEWVLTRERTGTDTDFTALLLAKLLRWPESRINKFVANEALLIMLVARSLVSNSELQYTAKCPHCGAVQKPSTVRVPDQLGVLGKKGQDYPGWEIIELPESKDSVKIRPALIDDARRAAELAGTDKGFGLSESALTTMSSILAVGDGEPESVKELATYFRALPPADVAYLQKYLRENSPALDTVIPHTCDNEKCKKPFSFNLGLHYDFFL